MSEKTDGLLAQHHLLIEIIHTEWATRLDHKVAAVIIERYFGKFGNSRASLRYLADRTKATRPNIISSVRRLVWHGAFSIIREGAGTRPTEYALNFNFSSGIVDDTSTSGIADDTSCGIVDDTSTGSSGIAYDTQTSLTVTGLQAGLQERDIDCAPASPPDAVGLEAAAPDGAQGGFEELWKAYGYRQKKADAKSAYLKVAPDTELHSRMVASARAWQERWAAQGKADAPRFTLAKWIEREEYECDPPTAFKPKERKAAAKKAKPETESEHAKPDFTIYPDKAAAGTIVRAKTEKSEDDGATILTVWFQTQDGDEVEHFIICESPDQDEHEQGMKDLRNLMRAVGLDQLHDSSELVDKQVELMLTHHGKFVSVSKPWVSSSKGPRNFPRFTDVVNRAPQLGWAKMIGTAEDEEQEAA
ncbi:hypothetical protein J2046_006782 [Rhizobium petrolearium]|uniref:hypothetical protein n=1 Tax=Neorhizobium petrolearium TaxID=515361 RepID=UPI001AE4A4A6|nr:hypothetical protein [Neorhizobium petrolearium]MBP1848486.1 hypothetical protein [Neorhizobium petrolearium]